LLALSAACCAVTLLAQSKQALTSLAGIPPGARLTNAVVAYATYLRKMAWPVDLAIFYPHPGARAPLAPALGAALLLVALTGLAWWCRRRRPAVLVGWLWYLGTLVPVIGLVQVGLQSLADRYTYFPLVGVFVALAWAVPDGLAERLWARAPLAVGALALLFACALLTRRQLSFWHDERTIWEHCLAVGEDNAVAHQSLGTYLYNRGQFDQGTEHLLRATQIDPDYPLAMHNLGVARLMEGRMPEALDLFDRAVAAAPRVGRYHEGLGVVLAHLGRRDEARHCFREAIRLAPADAQAYFDLAVELEDDPAAASAAYAEGLRRAPNWPETAIHQVWSLLRPQSARLRCPQQALRLARQINGATGNREPEVLATLAEAHAANGQMAQAAEVGRRALFLAAGAGNHALAAHLRDAVAHYEAARAEQNATPRER
jgi:tetratricopeptide (TPR) repeat protein